MHLRSKVLHFGDQGIFFDGSYYSVASWQLHRRDSKADNDKDAETDTETDRPPNRQTKRVTLSGAFGPAKTLKVQHPRSTGG